MMNKLSKIAAFYDNNETIGWRDGLLIANVHDSLEKDYQKIRKGIALADYTYLGHFRVQGSDALQLIDKLCFSNLRDLPSGCLSPSYVLNEDGSVFCEVLIANCGDFYRILSEGVEPAHVHALFDAELAAADWQASIVDETRSQSFIGLDGPYSWELLKRLSGPGIIGIRHLELASGNQLDGILFTLYRTDKTGEYGYLLQVDIEYVVDLWRQLLEVGRAFEIQPAGYAALDLCKLENRFTNIHREARWATHVLELNTRIAASRKKEDYIGRAAVEKTLHEGIRRRLIGLVLEEDAGNEVPIECGEHLYADGVKIGEVVNRAFSFTLNRWIALAFLEVDYAYVGLNYRLGGQRGGYAVKTVSAPFIFNESLRIRPRQDSYFDKTDRARAEYDAGRIVPLRSANSRHNRFPSVLADRRAYRRTVA